MKKVIVFITKLFKKTNLDSDKVNPSELTSISSDAEFSEIKIDSEIEKLITLTEKGKSRINEDIKKMIVYYNQRTDDIESRRTRLIESTWQTLTFLITASGVLIALKLPQFVVFPIVVIFLVRIIFALLKLLEFQIQSRFKYPFINFKYGNKWKWFYYGNPKILQINPNPFQRETKNIQNLSPYIDGLRLFISKYASETPESEISDNIQQLYLLQVHNFYKNRFYLRLLRYDKWADWITLPLICGFLLGAIVLLAIHLI